MHLLTVGTDCTELDTLLNLSAAPNGGSVIVTDLIGHPLFFKLQLSLEFGNKIVLEDYPLIAFVIAISTATIAPTSEWPTMALEGLVCLTFLVICPVCSDWKS